MLTGAGFALSDASDKSCLSQWIGHRLESLENLPNEVILLVVMVLTALVTEVASNVATVNVILPILIALVSIHCMKLMTSDSIIDWFALNVVQVVGNSSLVPYHCCHNHLQLCIYATGRT